MSRQGSQSPTEDLKYVARKILFKLRGGQEQGSPARSSPPSRFSQGVRRVLAGIFARPTSSLDEFFSSREGRTLVLQTSASTCAGRGKRENEDSFLISPDNMCIGVADGVGSSAEPALYSRALMSAANYARYLYDCSPVQMLQYANERVDYDGTSTACVIALRSEVDHASGMGRAVLEACNLGDSGFLVLDATRAAPCTPLNSLLKAFEPNRGINIVCKSRAQYHPSIFWPRAPYQLGPGPSYSWLEKDAPEDADEYVIPVEEGYIVVLATDGLWDNCSDGDVIREVARHIRPYGAFDTQQCAGGLRRLAYNRSMDGWRESPYLREKQLELRTRAAMGIALAGKPCPAPLSCLKWLISHSPIAEKGKEDDITVLVSSIQCAR